jgi:putative ABC transport system substrate-binding protein
MNLAADDPETVRRMAAFVQGLQELGWTDGRNVRIDYRHGLGDADRYRRYAADLVALAPDVILATGGTVVGALQQATPIAGEEISAQHSLSGIEPNEMSPFLE